MRIKRQPGGAKWGDDAPDFGGPVDRPYERFPETALEGSIIDRFDAIARRFLRDSQ